MSEIPNIRPGLPLVVERTRSTGDTAALLARLRPGQQVQAQVLEARLGQVLLRIGGTTLAAQSSTPLTAGTRLRLRVEQGLPMPILRILPEAPQRAAPPITLLRHALARQLSATEIRQQLARLALEEAEASPLARITAAALKTGVSTDQLNAATVRHQFERSGLFLEAHLAAGTPPPADDRKLILLRLRRQLLPEGRTAPSAEGLAADDTPRPRADQLLNRLLALVEGELGRIQQHQARALPGDDPNRQVWQFELPLRQGTQHQEVTIHIEQDRRTSTEDAPSTDWRVDIHFDFGELGKVSARVSLCDGQVRCAFHSQQRATARRFEQALPRLDTRLRDAGLKVAALSSLEGIPSRPGTAPPTGLLDEQA
ncbi:flagellar hook-length control protein FliK [endosymbiont of unidentified scaly snail isolate Monju]|uniref:flagellar hook-length control protein FliK n=1 Tax=endosymbiont of unidentified scaly snail isolate Monju TaxID=1248727 RepID=UPI0003892087|nr:flagellar hook-length control protein FliK [endosymbiont of unidentified scaly snail isolate Monju]BAN69406.1 hypothetical protein EBS_1521 [endosymbiont of unidentified scaly snail isolate Monju]